MKTVYIVGGGMAFTQMFQENGWEVVPNKQDAEFWQFTGGEDVSPILYGQRNVASGNSVSRDTVEVGVFREGLLQKKKLLGVCRGSQFLTVMSGHSLWQDVDNHAIGGTHKATMLNSGEDYDVTSTHHQMMHLNGDTPYELLMTASRTSYKLNDKGRAPMEEEEYGRDVEAVFYPITNALAFQPHPEFTPKGHSCQQAYFTLINNYF